MAALISGISLDAIESKLVIGFGNSEAVQSISQGRMEICTILLTSRDLGIAAVTRPTSYFVHNSIEVSDRQLTHFAADPILNSFFEESRGERVFGPSTTGLSVSFTALSDWIVGSGSWEWLGISQSAVPSRHFHSSQFTPTTSIRVRVTPLGALPIGIRTALRRSERSKANANQDESEGRLAPGWRGLDSGQVSRAK
jgi:hypothetical protein